MSDSDWNRVLTDEQVRELRELRAAGAPQSELAKRFGVSQAQVSRIVLGRQRRNAGGPIQLRKYAR